MSFVFITGGDRGIGRAAAIKFAKNNFDVIFSYYRDEGSAQLTLEEIKSIGARGFYVRLDVSSYDSVVEAYKLVESKVPYLNVLVNNAGILSTSSFEELSFEEWNRIISINLTGVFIVTKVFLPLLKKAPWASIVNVASIAGQSGHVRGSVAYVASKAGVIGLTRRLAVELAPHIRVNAVAPSFVDTDMTRDILSNPEERMRIANLHPLRDIAKPEDIAEAIFFLSTNASRFITGHTLNVNGGRLTI
ncbi:MAG: SDR family NAD(P)-dependent oxidoreductase [Acidilobaceae archaeon]